MNQISPIQCCQFNMSMNVFFLFLSLSSREAGAKVKLLFKPAKLFETFFWKNFLSVLTSISNELSLILRVAKVEPLFKSRKLFWNIFRFISKPFFKNHCSIFLRTSLVLRVAKVKTLFKSHKLFWKKFRFIFDSYFVSLTSISNELPLILPHLNFIFQKCSVKRLKAYLRAAKIVALFFTIQIFF